MLDYLPIYKVADILFFFCLKSLKSLPVCLSVSLCVCLSIYLSIYLSLSVTVCLSVCLTFNRHCMNVQSWEAETEMQTETIYLTELNLIVLRVHFKHSLTFQLILSILISSSFSSLHLSLSLSFCISLYLFLPLSLSISVTLTLSHSLFHFILLCYLLSYFFDILTHSQIVAGIRDSSRSQRYHDQSTGCSTSMSSTLAFSRTHRHESCGSRTR